MAELHVPYRAIRWILDGALVGLILIAILGAILGRLIPLTGRETLIIGGASMEPEIHLGAAIVIEPVRPDQLAVGDIVSLRSGEGLKSIFTHRITRIVNRSDGVWIETKGDANRIVDPSITPASDVIGRVVLNVPFGGFLLKLLSVPSGVALMVCLAGVLLTATWLVETAEVERRRWPRPATVPAVATATSTAATTVAAGADRRRARGSTRARMRTADAGAMEEGTP